MFLEACLGFAGAFGFLAYKSYKKSSSFDSKFSNLKSFLDESVKFDFDLNLRFNSRKNTTSNGNKFLLKLEKRILNSIDIYNLKISHLKNIDLLDIYLLDKYLLVELCKELENLKSYDIYLSDLNFLSDMLGKFDDVLSLDEYDIAYEEVILHLLFRSLEFVHILLKNKNDELNYEVYERQALKSSIESSLKSLVDSESLRNNYLNDFLILKKSLLNDSLSIDIPIDSSTNTFSDKLPVDSSVRVYDID